MTAAHPTTAAQLSPAHATRRENGCYIAGGAIPEMTEPEWLAFSVAVEQMANGWDGFGYRTTRRPATEAEMQALADSMYPGAFAVTIERIVNRTSAPTGQAPEPSVGADHHMPARPGTEAGRAGSYKPAAVTS